MKIAVAGGTGVVGQHVVSLAREQGHEVVSLSRRTGVDVKSRDGLTKALQGVDSIVDVTNSTSLSKKGATAFFTTVTGNLHAAGHEAGAQHLVVLSIVGLERAAMYGYYAAKLAQEAAATSGPLPTSLVRATQFHQFPAQVMSKARFAGFAVVPHVPVKTVSARAVAAVLLEVALQPPRTSTLEISGPEVADLADLSRALAPRQPRKTRVLSFRLPGRVGKAVRAGALLPSNDARIVGPTFDSWLSSMPTT